MKEAKVQIIAIIIIMVTATAARVLKASPGRYISILHAFCYCISMPTHEVDAVNKPISGTHERKA